MTSPNLFKTRPIHAGVSGVEKKKKRFASGLVELVAWLFSPVNLAFDLSLIAFYDFIFVSCLSCLKVCPNESLPKSDDRKMFKFAFEI